MNGAFQTVPIDDHLLNDLSCVRLLYWYVEKRQEANGYQERIPSIMA